MLWHSEPAVTLHVAVSPLSRLHQCWDWSNASRIHELCSDDRSQSVGPALVRPLTRVAVPAAGHPVGLRHACAVAEHYGRRYLRESEPQILVQARPLAAALTARHVNALLIRLIRVIGNRYDPVTMFACEDAESNQKR